MHKTITFKSSVKKDCKKIPQEELKLIFKKIKGFSSGESIQVKKLKGRFASCLSFRVGNYRIIYSEIGKGILISSIAHRKEVYKK